MIRIFVTGDAHFGMKHSRYPDVAEKLIESRYECLERCVRKAEEERCDLFVVTGDLFDGIRSVRKAETARIARILSGFEGRVLILPGNHDFYTGEELVWKYFQEGIEHSDNISLLTEMKRYSFNVGGESVCVYPAPCGAKHSSSNNIGWIKSEAFSEDSYNIGIAHGAIEGLTPDMNGDYFLMTEDELNAISMDIWLIGHTHIPYPKDLSGEAQPTGYRIFNPGTPEQTDLHNNTEGFCFIISLRKENGKSSVEAERFTSGRIRYYDLLFDIDGTDLREAVSSAVSGIPDKKNSIVRLAASGSVSESDYRNRGIIARELLGDLLSYEFKDDELSESITDEKIRNEFAEIGLAAKLLSSLNDPKERQLAYGLLKKHSS